MRVTIRVELDDREYEFEREEVEFLEHGNRNRQVARRLVNLVVRDIHKVFEDE